MERIERIRHFSPQLILSQLILIILLYYLSVFFFLFILGGFFSVELSTELLLSWRKATLESLEGYVALGSFFGASVVSCVWLLIFVQKARKCLDFAVSIFIFHSTATLWFSGIPWGWEWWVLHLGDTVLVAIAGEYLCWFVEMREMPLFSRSPGFSRRAPPNNSSE